MWRSLVCFALLTGLLPVTGLAQQQPPREKKHILFIGASQFFAHDSVSAAMYMMEKIGRESGLFDVRFHTDTELITKKKLRGNKKNLDWFDAVMFYGQGELPLTDEQKADLMSFIREDGKGFLGGHSATDAFRKSWPEYIEMVGGSFNRHPWHEDVRIIVEDRTFPATKHFPESFEITDEIYQLDKYSRDKVRVLMSLDVETVDLNAKFVARDDKDFAIAWVREWGKGRVFNCVLGHREAVYDRPDMQKMWLEAARWVLGMTKGDTTPLPKPGTD
ncbi:MAG: ThuA domain-containing protein [bacterium]|nr:ThuA domain-containing protein [bacterium]